MFTGIVEELGTVKRIVNGTGSIKLTVSATKILEDLTQGDSIAVNGVCLTAVQFTSNEFTADVMPETMKRTGLGVLKQGDRVNLERALTLASRLGGHIVSGHIDGQGEIVSMHQDDNAIFVRVAVPESLAKYIIKKGSVAIDGISLTVVDCGQKWFTVSLIPHTALITTIGFKKAGDKVNIENDIIGKYVERLLGFGAKVDSVQQPDRLTAEFLRNHGF